MKAKIKKFFGRIFKLLTIIAVVGFVYQWVATRRDRALYPPPGELYEVNGQTLHLVCMGERVSAETPSIIIESGMGSDSNNWVSVMEKLSAEAHVCAYDRPGLGWSAPSDHYLSEAEINTNLHDLLRIANVPPPYIMMGHSLGGVMVRDFTHKYRQDVVGMVLVESSTENQSKYWSSGRSNGRARLAVKILDPITRGASHLGVMRLYRIVRQTQRIEPLTDEKRPALARRNEVHYLHAMAGEALLVSALTNRAETSASFDDLPLNVIKKTYWTPEGSTDAHIKFENDWHQMQVDLSELSTNGTLTEAPMSGHNVPGDDPDLIVEKVLEILKQFELPNRS